MRQFWLNGRKVAFTTSDSPGYGFGRVGDVQVMEETSIGIGDADPPNTVKYKHTASFIVAADALCYLRAKYPRAEESAGGRLPMSMR